MTPFRAGSLAACLLGLTVLLSGCKTTTTADTFRYGFSDVQANSPSTGARPIPTDFQLRAKSWKHEWRCDAFDTCDTDFLSTVYVFDTRTGKQINWNRVEVFMKEDGCNASLADRAKYKTITDTEFVSFGWCDNPKGKHEHVSALLVFYADWGSVQANVRTIVCP